MNDVQIHKAQLLFWLVATLVAAALIAGAVFGIRLLLASPSGKAGAFRAKESSTNRVQKQELFEQLEADIAGYTAKIAVARDTYKASPTDEHLTELAGVRQECVDTVQQYNAESRKYSSRDFKAADLPYTHDTAECR
jgi:hypothetical protein